MPLTKKQRNRLWYGYVGLLVIYYEVVMAFSTSAMQGFLIAFGGIGVITAVFVVLMRRLSRTPSIVSGAPSRSAAGTPDANGPAASPGA